MRAILEQKKVRGKKRKGVQQEKHQCLVYSSVMEKYTLTLLKNCTREQLMPIIQGKILEGSTIYSDGWQAYDGLILNGYDHYRVFHSHDEFVRGKAHVNGIESFWSFTKKTCKV
ncbi:MAG: transposase [Pseudomonadales bacterium]|nr:transposase [Pseudomonadales bacterium]